MNGLANSSRTKISYGWGIGKDPRIGLEWLYYGRARILRPSRVIVIGFFCGFVRLGDQYQLNDNSFHLVRPVL